MKIILSAIGDDLAQAWQREFAGAEGVEIHRGSILDVGCEAVVSPANSFGFMDGGLDMTYSLFFGWQVEERLQKIIREHFCGELLVGQAALVETGHARIPYVIAAPTMRVPLVLTDTVNPYLACRAVLNLMVQGVFPNGPHQGKHYSSVIQTIAFPGLGTGVGMLNPATCARQMQTAIAEYRSGGTLFPESLFDAQLHHQKLCLYHA